jgi:hypothetical protein
LLFSEPLREMLNMVDRIQNMQKINLIILTHRYTASFNTLARRYLFRDPGVTTSTLFPKIS